MVYPSTGGFLGVHQTGATLLKVFEGHEDLLMGMAFSPSGELLASCGADCTVRLWDVKTGACVARLEGHENWVRSVAFHPSGEFIVSGSDDLQIKIWNVNTLCEVGSFTGHENRVFSVAFNPEGTLLASASDDRTVRIWDFTARANKPVQILPHEHWVYCVTFDSTGQYLASCDHLGNVELWKKSQTDYQKRPLNVQAHAHQKRAWSVAFHPQTKYLASSSLDHSIKLWNPETGEFVRELVGHTGGVQSIAFSADGQLFASKGRDGMVCLWGVNTWTLLTKWEELTLPQAWLAGIAFSPADAILATAGPVRSTPIAQNAKSIHLWQLDYQRLFKERTFKTTHYVNAKVVLLGDTGVGKTALASVLSGDSFRPSVSTAGRYKHILETSEDIDSANNITRRATLLWDLAGQPGYRLIHQLFLDQVSVAIVVFDGRNEVNTESGIKHSVTALRAAKKRADPRAVSTKKLLVNARCDVTGPTLSKDRLDVLIKTYGFDDYFETSAKENIQIKELRTAIGDAIEWGNLPVVTSTDLLDQIEQYVRTQLNTDRVIITGADFFDGFLKAYPLQSEPIKSKMKVAFETCLSRLENLGLLRVMNFLDYILIRPDLLDGYAYSLVLAAKEEPDRFGSILESKVLSGEFKIPKEFRLVDKNQEKKLVRAVIEELISHDVVLKEQTIEGPILVFPTEFGREFVKAPEPFRPALSVTFDGPGYNIYATLIVRLSHSGYFETNRSDLYRDAAIFQTKIGGQCGIHIAELSEARWRVETFYAPEVTAEFRFHFEEFIVSHIEHHADLASGIVLTKTITCPNCLTPFTFCDGKENDHNRGNRFECRTCGETVSVEKNQFESKTEYLNEIADREREFQQILASLDTVLSIDDEQMGSSVEPSFLAFSLVEFTLHESPNHPDLEQITDAHLHRSVAIMEELGGTRLVRRASKFIAAFYSVAAAFEFLNKLRADPGDPTIVIKGALHVGPLRINDFDIQYGATISTLWRLLAVCNWNQLVLSDYAKRDIEVLSIDGLAQFEGYSSQRVALPGVNEEVILWKRDG